MTNLSRFAFGICCVFIPACGGEVAEEAHVTGTSAQALLLDSGHYVMFSEPKGSPASPTHWLQNTLSSLLDATPGGSRVDIAMYDWDTFWNSDGQLVRPGSNDRERGFTCWPALQRALNRGVRANVALRATSEGEGNIPALKEVQDWLRDGMRGNCPVPVPAGQPNVQIELCDNADSGGGGSCLGTHNLHSKLMTFEFANVASVDGIPAPFSWSTNITVITSHNFDMDGMKRRNDAAIVFGDGALYRGARDYITAMRARDTDGYDQTVDGDSWTWESVASGASTALRGYFFPRTTPNFWVSVLGDLQCPWPHDNQLGIVMGSITNGGRALEIRDAINAFAEDCPRVTVIGGHEAEPSWFQGLGPNVDWIISPSNVPNNPHQKTVWFDAHYNGTSPRKLVFTGTANFTSSAMNDNEEVMLRIEDTGTWWQVHDQFVDNCYDLKSSFQAAGRGSQVFAPNQLPIDFDCQLRFF